MRLTAGEKPQRSGRHVLEPLLHGRFGSRRNWNQAFLAPLAEDHEERLVRPDCTSRQADELGSAQARSIKQLEQREITYRSCLSARCTVFAGLEHPLDLILI